MPEFQKNVIISVLHVQRKYAVDALSEYTAYTFLTSKAVKMYGDCILVNTTSKLLQ